MGLERCRESDRWGTGLGRDAGAKPEMWMRVGWAAVVPDVTWWGLLVGARKQRALGACLWCGYYSVVPRESVAS